MSLTHVSCPNCAADNTVKWAEESGFTAVKCVSCGLIYVDPRPDEDEVSEANKLGVHNTGEGRLVVTTRRKPHKVSYYARLISQIFSREISAGKPIRWLDIGAGYGEVVEAAVKVLPPGSQVTGIEPMTPKVAVAHSLGLPVFDLSLADLRGPFDVVSLINVFSHVPDFRAFLAQIREKMERDGILFLETGNGADLQSREEYPDLLYLPDHLVFGGRSQLRTMLGAEHFDIELERLQRVDTFLWAMKVFILSLRSGRPVVKLPFTSPFRTMFLKARLGSVA